MQAALPKLNKLQRRIARSKARFKVVACGRRWGKTTLGLSLAMEAAQRGERVWWVAPTYGLALSRGARSKKSAAKSARPSSNPHATSTSPAAGRSPSNRQTTPIDCAAWGWTSW